MCISAEASFGLAGVLAPVGAYCLKVAAQRDPRALPTAAIPLLFGGQQFAEGLVWVGLGRGDAELTRSAAMVFLFFALAFWLFWIPCGAVFLESRKKVRLALGLGACAGLVVGVILFGPVVLHPEDLNTILVQHSIRYEYTDPPALKVAPQLVWHLLYVAVIALPWMLSTEKKLIGFSTALVISAAISHLYFLYAFASIWCFFAACLSLYLGWLFHGWPQRQATS